MAITKIQSESLNLADTYAFTGTVTGTPSVDHINSWYVDSDTSLPANVDTVVPNWSQKDNLKGSAMTESSGVFTFPATGIYKIFCSLAVYNGAGSFVPYVVTRIQQSTDSGSNWTNKASAQNFIGSDGSGNRWHQCYSEIDIDITNISTDRLRVTAKPNSDACNIENGGTTSYITFSKIADT